MADRTTAKRGRPRPLLMNRSVERFTDRPPRDRSYRILGVPARTPLFAGDPRSAERSVDMALSSDPEKRARQLANLTAGRRKAAENALRGDSTAEPRSEPASSTEAAAEIPRVQLPDDPPAPPPAAADDTVADGDGARGVGTSDAPAPAAAPAAPDEGGRRGGMRGWLSDPTGGLFE